ncbi:MAG: PLP-dependent aminotransferase family protein [Bryobacteraceae bacterium]
MESPKDVQALAGKSFPWSLTDSLQQVSPVPWRRRALMGLGGRLRRMYAHAMDCSTGRPDPGLLPVEVIRRAWSAAVQGITASDLQYASQEAIEPLACQLIALLESDAIPARVQDLMVGSSAQQFMLLACEMLAARWGSESATIAVEEPGYPTMMDTFERAGARLIGMATDDSGVTAESLDAALRNGAKAAVFTPRAHNPTGASWSRERRTALADVLAAHPDVVAIEDDQFGGIANTPASSMLSDARMESRTLYIRSFSKAIAPDLRIAAAVARPVIREWINNAKSFADGWTSRLLQRVLAAILQDDELGEALNLARQAYNQRRERAAEAVNRILIPLDGGTWCGPDGLNLWVNLPPGVDAKDAVERSAAAGVRVADGEPFFVRPGHHNVVRLNAGSVPTEAAAEAGRLLAESVANCGWSKMGPIHV